MDVLNNPSLISYRTFLYKNHNLSVFDILFLYAYKIIIKNLVCRNCHSGVVVMI